MQEPLHLFSSYLDLSIWIDGWSTLLEEGWPHGDGGGRLVRSTEFQMPVMGSLVMNTVLRLPAYSFIAPFSSSPKGSTTIAGSGSC